jgi:hypothetical protein
MATVQFGVFKKFKGWTTLLVWGDGAGMAELAALFRGMADGIIPTVQFERLPWTHSQQGTRVRMSVVSQDSEGEELSQIGDKWLVEWRGLTEQFVRAADFVDVLVPEQCTAGHQYLDTSTFQFMVSKGEYSADFPNTPFKLPTASPR